MDSVKTCGRPLAKGQWWLRCGETDMGQTMPAQCIECEPKYGYLLMGATEEEVATQAKKIDDAIARYKAAGCRGQLQDY